MPTSQNPNLNNRIKRTSPLPEAPSALHKLIWELNMRRESSFNSVVLANELAISALEFRQALQAFVNMELMTYICLVLRPSNGRGAVGW